MHQIEFKFCSLQTTLSIIRLGRLIEILEIILTFKVNILTLSAFLTEIFQKFPNHLSKLSAKILAAFFSISPKTPKVKKVHFSSSWKVSPLEKSKIYSAFKMFKKSHFGIFITLRLNLNVRSNHLEINVNGLWPQRIKILKFATPILDFWVSREKLVI